MNILLIVVLVLTLAFLGYQLFVFFKHDLPKIKEKRKQKQEEKNKSVNQIDRKE